MATQDWNKEDWQKAVVGGSSAALAIATLGVLFFYVIWKGGAGGPANRWQGLAMLAVAVVLAAGVGAIVRFTLAPLISQIAPAPPTDADVAVRGRIAPLVLSIGTAGIAALTIALIISFVVLAQTKDPVLESVRSKIDVLLTGTFSTVLPVIATWVGTALAFYFGAENFRQAAKSTREALGERLPPPKKVTDVMTPYERIACLLATNLDDAKKTPMDDVISLMSQPINRIIVFDEAKKPLLIVRSERMTKGWMTAQFKPDPDLDKGGQRTIADYLQSQKGNEADATNFDFIEVTATIEDASNRMMAKKAADLFVTQDGKAGSTIGWLTDHDIRKVLEK